MPQDDPFALDQEPAPASSADDEFDVPRGDADPFDVPPGEDGQPKPDAIHMPAPAQALALQQAYEYFNQQLFAGALDSKRVLLTWTRVHYVVAGLFAPDKWKGEDGRKLHEVAINANVMKRLGLPGVMQTLVHEMHHQRQHDDGSAGRAGYHNAEFCSEMRRTGLMPIDTKTGEEVKPGAGAHGVSDKVIPGGLFELALRMLPAAAVPPYETDKLEIGGGEEPGGGEPPEPGDDDSRDEPEPPKKEKTRTKYTCPVCGVNVWGKPGMGGRLGCNDCGKDLIEQEG